MPERMGRMRKKKRGRQSSDPSSSAGISTEETPATRSPDVHSSEELTKKLAKGIKRIFKELKEEINERHNQLKEEINERHNQLKEESNERHNQLKEGINEIHNQLKKLIENHIVPRTQLEHLNGSSGDGSPAPRSEANQMQPPTFSLKFESEVGNTVEKGKSITIKVKMYDGGNPIGEKLKDGRPHPLASAKVMVVVLDGKFNDNRSSWSKADFKESIKTSTAGDVNQGIVSNCVFYLSGGTGRHSGATIWENSGNKKVKLGVMVLPDDSYEEYKNERVLEGVSKESFLVRDPRRPSKKQKEAVEHFRSPLAEQERNGPMPNTQYLSWPTLNTQTAGNRQLQLQAYTNMPSSSSTPRDNTLGADPQRSVEPSTNQQPSSFSERHHHIFAGGVQMSMMSGLMNQTMHSPDGGAQTLISGLADQTMHSPTGQALVGCGQERNGTMPNTQYSSCPTFTQTAGNIPGKLPLPAYTGNNTHGVYPQHLVEPVQQLCSVTEGHNHSGGGAHSPTISDFVMDVPSYSLPGVSYLEHIIRPVQLLWDRPGVEPSKRWNLLDQLMPLYSSQTMIHSGDFPTMRLVPEHYDSLTACSQGPYQRLFFNEQALFLKKMMRDLPITTIPKEVMQTHRNRGVLIQPLEPDDSDNEPPLKRKLRNKYQLRFVNKVCEAYYTGEKIKADDGNLLNVALYDENNAKITSGPLSSASVEVVVLHGDFNATGQDYWTSEEFSSCVVCPQSRKEPTAVGGDRVLVLVDGQASLGDAFFQKSSIYARTGKFKMGVMLASTSDDRVREGISEPFSVWIRKGGRTGCTVFQRWHRAINAIIFISRLQSEPYMTRSMRRPMLSMWRRAINAIIFISRLQSGTDMARWMRRPLSSRWHIAINAIIFISRLQSGTYMTRSMRRPLLSRDTGDACLEQLKEKQWMQHRLLDAWTSGVEGFDVQLPKAAVTKNVTLLDPRNKGTPYHKMLKKGDILDVKDEEYPPFADIKENDNEDAAEEAHGGNSGKEKDGKTKGAIVMRQFLDLGPSGAGTEASEEPSNLSTASFKQVVQMLTGAEQSSNNATATTTAGNSSAGVGGSQAANGPCRPKKPAFKLYERRSSLKNLKMIAPLAMGAPPSPRKVATPEILSPSVLDFPSLTLLTGDPFNRSPASSSEEAERAAIAEKGFFLHPSPRVPSRRACSRSSPSPRPG